MCRNNKYELSEEAETYARELFTSLYEERDDNFGNGREVRNQFENMVTRQANRVAKLEAPTRDDLVRIEKADLIPAPDEEEEEEKPEEKADTEEPAEAGKGEAEDE